MSEVGWRGKRQGSLGGAWSWLARWLGGGPRDRAQSEFRPALERLEKREMLAELGSSPTPTPSAP